MKRIAFIALGVCLFSTSAFAQATDQPRGSSGTFQGYVEGIGGLTFGTESGSMFAGEIGVDLSPKMEVYGSIGRMQNIAPRYINNQLDAIEPLLTVLTGTPWDFTVKAPSFFAVGGVRMRLPAGERMHPYVLGGLGFGSIKVTVTEATLGDFTEQMLTDGYFVREDFEATKLLFELGGGIEVPVGSMHLDVGYRFGKFLGVEDANVSRVYGGIGFRFGR